MPKLPEFDSQPVAAADLDNAGLDAVVNNVRLLGDNLCTVGESLIRDDPNEIEIAKRVAKYWTNETEADAGEVGECVAIAIKAYRDEMKRQSAS